MGGGCAQGEYLLLSQFLPLKNGIGIQGLRRSGQLSTDQKPRPRWAVPAPGLRAQGQVCSWRRGLADPYSPMRKVGAGYHVALRVTGLGEVPSTVQMRTRSRRAPGSCCFPKSPSWGVADSGLGSRRPCQTCLSHSFFCVNSWKIPPQLREQAIWSAGIWHVTAQ